MKENWKHEELAEDLARIKGTGYLDVPLGSVYLQRPQRADIIEIKPSYTRFCLSVYEIKISRSDFLSDIRTEKWKGYLEHCNRFYFAVPSGMVKKEEIPEPAGLIVRGETGWNTLKAAKVLDTEVSNMTLLSMLFNKQKQDSYARHRDKICKAASYYFMSREEKLKTLKTLGNEISTALRKQYEFEDSKDRYDKLVKRLKSDIADALGVKADEATWELSELMRAIKRKAKEDSRVQETT